MATVGKGKDPNCVLEDIYPEIEQGNAWENSIHGFIDCILKGERPFVTGVEGARSMAVILAAYESAKKGCWTKVGKV